MTWSSLVFCTGAGWVGFFSAYSVNADQKNCIITGIAQSLKGIRLGKISIPPFLSFNVHVCGQFSWCPNLQERTSMLSEISIPPFIPFNISVQPIFLMPQFTRTHFHVRWNLYTTLHTPQYGCVQLISFMPSFTKGMLNEISISYFLLFKMVMCDPSSLRP